MASTSETTTEVSATDTAQGEGSPEAVMDAAVKMEPFETQVLLPQHDGPLYVTGRIEGNFSKYRVHERPGDGIGGYVGEIGFKRGFLDAEPEIKFFPADDDAEPEPVERLKVSGHGRTDQLDAILTELRTELTDTNWETDPGRTSYGEWISASTTLREFAVSECPHLTETGGQIFHRSEVEHAIARYPHGAVEVMNSVTMAVERDDELTFEEVNPEAVRAVLFRYAAEHLD
ncbi:hypothetical protein ACFQDD_06985 [Halorubrum pallidum]|uniref:Uncharacterized protein n=1 Tax=Halorubrum pallidum TaxID=1526114 RepID=A0ABD5T297_9EURY